NCVRLNLELEVGERRHISERLDQRNVLQRNVDRRRHSARGDNRGGFRSRYRSRNWLESRNRRRCRRRSWSGSSSSATRGFKAQNKTDALLGRIGFGGGELDAPLAQEIQCLTNRRLAELKPRDDYLLQLGIDARRTCRVLRVLVDECFGTGIELPDRHRPLALQLPQKPATRLIIGGFSILGTLEINLLLTFACCEVVR